MEFAAWAVIVGAFAINYLAFRARAGTLTRQSWAGIRTRTTMASDEAWRTAHDIAWPWLVAGAWIMALSGAIALGVSNSDELAAFILLGGLVVAGIPFAVGAMRGLRAAGTVQGDDT